MKLRNNFYLKTLIIPLLLFSCNPKENNKDSATPEFQKQNSNKVENTQELDRPFSTSTTNNSNNSQTNSTFNYLPTSTTNQVYTRDTYTFSYNEDFEQSEWVAYELTSLDTKYKNYKRPYFNQDPIVKTKSADWKNYKNVPYNKGHLLPAADRRKSFNEFKETFYTSNISPQNPEFNAGVWNRLEQKVRYWANKYDGLYVITAGVLEPNLKTIGYEKVAVPNYFYKVLLTKDKSKMIGFLVPHVESDKPLYEFVTSVDEIEKRTGIDFFADLPDNLEDKLEKNTSYKQWSFN